MLTLTLIEAQLPLKATARVQPFAGPKAKGAATTFPLLPDRGRGQRALVEASLLLTRDHTE